MNEIEKISIKEALAGVFAWIREREPGPLYINWGVQSAPSQLIVDMILPSLQLNSEERETVGDMDALRVMNGAAPRSLATLEKALIRLFTIGAQLAINIPDGDGAVIRMAVPGNGDPIDMAGKIQLIREEIYKELKTS